jgi:hypothetical protein
VGMATSNDEHGVAAVVGGQAPGRVPQALALSCKKCVRCRSAASS